MSYAYTSTIFERCSILFLKVGEKTVNETDNTLDNYYPAIIRFIIFSIPLIPTLQTSFERGTGFWY